MNPLATPVDYILLAGQRSPGVALLPGGASSPRKWDERKGYGTSGSTIVFTGEGLAKFSVKIQLVTRDDWAAWDAWAPLVKRSPKGDKPKATDIWHPILEEHGIASVVVEDLVGPTQVLDGTAWEWELKFIQYRAPKPALAKPQGSAGTSTQAAQPKSPTDQLIADLTGQVQELAAG